MRRLYLHSRFVPLAAWLAALLSQSCAIGAELRFREGRHKQGELRYVDGVPVLFVEGSPEEIAEQWVNLLVKTTRPLMKFPREFLKQGGRERFWPLALAMGRVLLKNISDSHRKEMQAGLALAGKAGLDTEALIMANTMLELRRAGGCSSLIVTAGRSKSGGVLFGRNLDFPPMGILHKYSLVTVCRPKGRRAFVSIGFPGLSGVISGVNDAGLAVATLDVYQSKDGSPMFDAKGSPMSFTFRRVLEECATVAQAEKLLRSARHTTWMNLAVADKTGGAVFELTPRSVAVRKPNREVLTCTNHFRSPKLARSTFCTRFAAIERCRSLKQIGLQDVRKHLHAAHQGTMTLQTMIFEPTAGKLHVAFGKGPTTKRRLTTLSLAGLLNRRPVSTQLRGNSP